MGNVKANDIVLAFGTQKRVVVSNPDSSKNCWTTDGKDFYFENINDLEYLSSYTKPVGEIFSEIRGVCE